jgi:Cu-Zn family superoxide dismutase
MKKLVLALVVLGVPMMLLSTQAQEQAKQKGATHAVAVIHGFKEDSHIKGVVHFWKTEDGIEVKGEISGLTPGPHGFHIHEYGDCSSADPKCHGGHFNPEKKKHGGPDTDERHVGDLGNIMADESGKATISMRDKQIALSGRHNIIGRSVILHAKADDLKTDPAGNAGDRIAGGVVGRANPAEDHKK